MSNLSGFVENTLIPVVGRFSAQRHVDALRSGFLASLPLTLIGSLFLLITDFPVDGYQHVMTTMFGAGWDAYINPAIRGTFNILALVLAGTIAYKLADHYDIDKLAALVIALSAFVIVTPKVAANGSGAVVEKVLPFQWLGGQGIITAIIIAMLSTEIFNLVVKKRIIIRLPESVPEMVSRSFSALIPGFMVLSVALVIHGLCLTHQTTFPELLYRLIQIPLQNLTASVPGITIVAALNGLIWWFGVHPTVVNSIVYPMLNANSMDNLALAQSGMLNLQNAKIGTVQMLDQFATLGGAGMSIGCIIAMLIVCKSSHGKAISRVGLIPSFFNISEPITFGLPIILNPLMVIPLIISPVVSVLLTWLAIAIGFMSPFNGVVVPWPTPAIFGGLLVSGWQGAVMQGVIVITSTLIYYPFVKLVDREYQKEEIQAVTAGENML